MFKLPVFATLALATLACAKPVPNYEVEFFVGSKQISKVTFDAKPFDLSTSPERAYVFPAMEGKHNVSWTIDGVIKNATFEVTGPGTLTIRRLAPFIEGEDGVHIITQAK